MIKDVFLLINEYLKINEQILFSTVNKYSYNLIKNKFKDYKFICVLIQLDGKNHYRSCRTYQETSNIINKFSADFSGGWIFKYSELVHRNKHLPHLFLVSDNHYRVYKGTFELFYFIHIYYSDKPTIHKELHM